MICSSNPGETYPTDYYAHYVKNSADKYIRLKKNK